MLSIPKVAQYARFSSDNQRSESIDAQIRAMKACNNKELNKDYLDAYIAVLIGERLKPKNLKRAVAKVNQQVQKFNHDFDANHEAISAQYAEIQDSLANITRRSKRASSQMTCSSERNSWKMRKRNWKPDCIS